MFGTSENGHLRLVYGKCAQVAFLASFDISFWYQLIILSFFNCFKVHSGECHGS